MNKVKWRSNVRPSKEEAEFGINGMRTDHNGARLEVRILSTVEDGLHVAWKVGRSAGELSATGKVDPMDPLIGSLSLGEVMHDAKISKERMKQALLNAVEWAKKRAELIAAAWAKPEFKLGTVR